MLFRSVLREGDLDTSPGQVDRININDFAQLSGSYGTSTSNASNPRADMNQSGYIDVLDFSLLASNYGANGATAIDGNRQASVTVTPPIASTLGFSQIRSHAISFTPTIPTDKVKSVKVWVTASGAASVSCPGSSTTTVAIAANGTTCLNSASQYRLAMDESWVTTHMARPGVLLVFNDSAGSSGPIAMGSVDVGGNYMSMPPGMTTLPSSEVIVIETVQVSATNNNSPAMPVFFGASTLSIPVTIVPDVAVSIEPRIASSSTSNIPNSTVEVDVFIHLDPTITLTSGQFGFVLMPWGEDTDPANDLTSYVSEIDILQSSVFEEIQIGRAHV